MDILSEVIKNVYRQYGPNGISDGSIIMRSFLEQAPNAQQEAQLLDAFLKAGGNLELLKVMNADHQMQLQCRSWLTGILSSRYAMPYYEAKRVVESCWTGLSEGKVQPVQPTAAQRAVSPAAQFAAPQPAAAAKKKSRLPVAIIAAAVAVLLIGAAVAGFLLFGKKDSAAPGSSASMAAPQPTEAPATEHVHDWVEATCTEPRRCISCSETQGEPLGHDWIPATRTAPKTCTRCGQTEGSVLVVYSPGDLIVMGTYPQNSSSSGSTDFITWIVLEFDEANNRALVISEYCLDTIPFDSKDGDGVWETSTLRTWLNQYFLTNAFTPAEQARILPTVLAETTNPTSHRSCGSTEDQIFVLSLEEAEYYFPSDPARQGTPTTYCYAHGCYDPVVYARNHNTPVKPEEVGHTWWWLRTPGMDANRVCNVVSKGTASTYGAEYYHSEGTVRPVMWIQLG